MSEPLMVKVSRDGKEIGTYESKEAIRQFVYGTLLATDFFWHDGMKAWASLGQLQASVARWQESQAALRESREKEALVRAEQEKSDAERLRKLEQDQEKSSEEAKANWFRCHCCRESFSEPQKSDAKQVGGLLMIIGSGVVSWMASELGLDGYRSSVKGLMIGQWFAVVIFFLGLSNFTVAILKSPCCPVCESTNFAKPEKADAKK
jgi:hypothetical protein